MSTLTLPLSLWRVEIRWEHETEVDGEEWCQAVATVRYPVAGRYGMTWRLQTFHSGGMGAVDIDSSPEYKREIEDEQLVDLFAHLEVFGVDVGNFWTKAGRVKPCVI